MYGCIQHTFSQRCINRLWQWLDFLKFQNVTKSKENVHMLLSSFKGRQPIVTSVKNTVAASTLRQACGSPSQSHRITTLSLLSIYTAWRTACPSLLLESAAAEAWTCNRWVTSLMPYPSKDGHSKNTHRFTICAEHQEWVDLPCESSSELDLDSCYCMAVPSVPSQSV